MFPIDRAPDILRRWRDWADAAPDEVSTGCTVILAPPEEFIPPQLHGQPVLGIPVLYAGDPEAGTGAVQPLKDLGPAVDHIGPMPHTTQATLDPLAPWGAGGGFTPAGNTCHSSATARSTHSSLRRRPGHTQPPVQPDGHLPDRARRRRNSDEATAFPHRDANYLFHPITAWLDPADEQQMMAATRAFAAAMRPFSTGASYLNFTHEADRVRDVYGDGKYARLVALKDTYDPADLFRLNQNVRPSHTAARTRTCITHEDHPAG